MFQLLQPLMMWAAAGIIVPVIIHLWNTREGRVLKVGSVALLSPATEQSARRIKFSQLLLLLLRCGIVLLLAVFLSTPVWINHLSADKEKGWIIADPEYSNLAYTLHGKLIDSLINAGYTIRKWDTGFAQISLKELLPQEESGDGFIKPVPWNLLRNLNGKLPAGYTVYIFSSNSLQDFTGARPATALDIRWYSFAPQDSVQSFISNTYGTGDDSVSFALSVSTPSGILRQRMFKPILLQDTNTVQIRSSDSGLLVSLGSGQSVLMDTAVCRIVVVKEKNQYDAEAVIAALSAIKETGKFNLQIEVRNTDEQIESGFDWIFWLSDQPMPESILAKHIFQYAIGSGISLTADIVPGETHLHPAAPVHLFKKNKIAEDHLSGAHIILKDSYGDPLLVHVGSLPDRYFFLSRLNNSWNDLTWNELFPELIFNLVVRSKYNEQGTFKDTRKIDTAQLRPEWKSSGEYSPAAVDTMGLSSGVWALIFLLFIIERLLSTRNKGRLKNA